MIKGLRGFENMNQRSKKIHHGKKALYSDIGSNNVAVKEQLSTV